MFNIYKFLVRECVHACQFLYSYKSYFGYFPFLRHFMIKLLEIVTIKLLEICCYCQILKVRQK